ncbi:MAG: LPS export ABC transporter permease LptG [Candidatus Eiseniibacteriota bacterium]
MILRLLDRYLLREFLTLLALSLCAFIVIFAIVDLFEKIQDFMDGHASAWIIARYYAYKIPWVIVQVLPVALLMSTFLTLGQMSKFNELTAMVTAGLSTGRIILPMLAVGLLCVGLSFLLNESIVPDATRKRDAILDTEVRRRVPGKPPTYANLTVLGHEGRVYTAKLYHVAEQTLHDVTITEFKENAIARRIDARTARWDGHEWTFRDGVDRTFEGDREIARPFATLRIPDLPERPADFEKESEDPDEMGFAALSEYVKRLRQSGLRVEKYVVDLHLKIAFPFINLIVVVMGAALASRMRNANAALGFGISVFTAFFYYGLMRAGQALGQAGTVSPIAAAWFANALFGAVATVLLIQAQRR